MNERNFPQTIVMCSQTPLIPAKVPFVFPSSNRKQKRYFEQGYWSQNAHEKSITHQKMQIIYSSESVSPKGPSQTNTRPMALHLVLVEGDNADLTVRTRV